MEHAAMQALQPTQVLRSMTIAYFVIFIPP
jgi:hypothetical protein